MRRSRGERIVLMPIGEAGTEIRTRADFWFDKIIAPALEDAAYLPIRADRLDEGGFISAQIFKHVMNDPMVVADLTDGNPNVYYELAIRHACRKPIVHLLQEGRHIPFHVAPLRAVRVDDTSPTTVERSRKEIAQFVLVADERRYDHESPVALALGKWFLSAHPRVVPRECVESLVLSYLGVSFAAERRELPERCLRCHGVRKELAYLEAALHYLTDSLGMPEPDAFADYEKYRWNIIHQPFATRGKAGVEISEDRCDGAPVVKGTGVRLKDLLVRLKVFLMANGFYTPRLRVTQEKMEDLLEVAEELLVASARDRREREAAEGDASAGGA
jgi:hypothetical protein